MTMPEHNIDIPEWMVCLPIQDFFKVANKQTTRRLDATAPKTLHRIRELQERQNKDHEATPHKRRSGAQRRQGFA